MVALIDRPDRQSAGTSDDTILGHLLGSTLRELPPSVRRFHASTEDVVGTGTFCVEQAGSRAGGLVARAMRMPRITGDTPVTLSIVRRPRVGRGPRIEQWRRIFGEEVIASTQTTDGQHLLERIGPLELRFVIDVAEERMRFRHVATRLRVGPIRLRVPQSMSPEIVASVGAVGERLDVSVRIRAPLLGTIFQYAGQLEASDGT